MPDTEKKASLCTLHCCLTPLRDVLGKQYCGASAKVSGYQGSMTEQCTKHSQGSDIFCMIYHGRSMSLNVYPSPKSMEFYVDVMLMVGKAAFGCLEHCRSNSAFLCT